MALGLKIAKDRQFFNTRRPNGHIRKQVEQKL